MTLEQLATASGLTRSYLSKIERGMASPSASSALKLSSALGVTLGEPLQDKGDREPHMILTRASQGVAGDPKAHLSLVAGRHPDQTMRAFVIRPTRTVRQGRMMSDHEGEEILFVLSGSIELLIGKRKEVLVAGDCVQFSSTLPHRLTALSEEPASALMIIAACRQEPT